MGDNLAQFLALPLADRIKELITRTTPLRLFPVAR
jgi:hypothetical protein